jgi:CubicO group peptidase (beta-lactamase class C family)
MRPSIIRALAMLSAAMPAVAQTSDLAAKVDRVFARFDRTTPGCAVGLAKDGRPLYTHGYGLANLEYGVPLTDSTVLESGSVAKQFTAAALVLLQQDGKLSLDDDIRKYLPEVPSFGGQKITIRNLLTHTSGLRDQWGLLGIEGRGPGTQVHSPMTTLDLITHQKMLNFPVGSEYLYSNSGYALAGLIVQRVSGKSLDAFTQERLFRPIGMTHTQWRDDFTEVVPNRATAYSGTKAGGYHTDMPFTNMIGNGGLLSTMSDLLAWNENLDNPRVGGRAFVDAMQTTMRLTSGRSIVYALGLNVTELRGVREVSHDGSTAGYRTYLGRFPEQHVSVAVWCNDAESNPSLFGHQVADLVLTYTQTTATGATAEKVELAPGTVERWPGIYRDAHTDRTIVFAVANGSLVNMTGRGAQAWAARGGTRFSSPQGDGAFSGERGRRVFTVFRPAGDTARYEEVQPAATPLPAHDYVGDYTSDELDVRLTVVSRDGKVFIRRRPADEFELRPAYRDDFETPGPSSLGTVRFSRDAGGKVTGLSIFAGRVLDVRFKRAVPK